MCLVTRVIQKTIAAKKWRNGRDTFDGATSGIFSGTSVATAMGWRDVAGIAEGDLVMTFDAGLQPVKKVTREPLWEGVGKCPRKCRPLSVPAGALGNTEHMYLPPRQGVMLESDAAEEHYGDPFALIASQALEGALGIERIYPRQQMVVVKLFFEHEQVVFAEQGALLFCSADCFMTTLVQDQVEAAPSYQMLPTSLVDALVSGGPALAA